MTGGARLAPPASASFGGRDSRHRLVSLSNRPHVRARKFSFVGVLNHCLNRVIVT
jgi:hypothetical protein